MRKLINDEKDKEEFIFYLKNIEIKKTYVAEISVFRKKRTLKQNALFYLWLRCISDETGNDVDTLHDHFCEKHLGWQATEVMGEYHRVVPGTKNLTTKEFDTFLENIRMDMLNNLNIHLPLPDEQGFNEFSLKYGESK